MKRIFKAIQRWAGIKEIEVGDQVFIRGLKCRGEVHWIKQGSTSAIVNVGNGQFTVKRADILPI